MIPASILPRSLSWLRAGPARRVAGPATDRHAGTGGLVYQRIDDPDLIGEDWAALERESGTAFQTRHWFTAWHGTAGRAAGETPAIITCRDAGGHLLALAPLVVARRRGALVLTTPGGTHAAYHRPLVAPGADLPDPFLFAPGSGAWPLFGDMDAISIDGLFIGDDRDAAAFRGLHRVSCGHSFHRMDLGPDWEAIYASKFSSRVRSTDRRKERRLAQAGDLRVVVPGTLSEQRALLSRIIAQKSDWFRALNKRDIFASPAIRAFYGRLAMEPADGSGPHMLATAVMVGGQLLAGYVGLVHRGMFHSMIVSTTDSDLRRHSPGSLALRKLIEICCERGLSTFDFGAGDQGYKLEYADSSVPLSHGSRPRSLRGMPIAVAEQAKIICKNKGLLIRDRIRRAVRPE